HFKELNPHISLHEIPAVIPTSTMNWPEGRRVAGISSFGFTGTNAHVVVEAAPAREAPAATAVDRPRHVLALSAKTESALLAMAGRFAEHLAAEPSLSMADVAFSATTGRRHFAHRLAGLAETAAQAAAKLEAVAVAQDARAPMPGQVLRRDHPELGTWVPGPGQ